MFEDGNLQRLLERGFADGVVKEFILVAADYTGPTTGSLYENSPVSGRWLDYAVDEVVPLVDGKYRTLARRESRAVVGDFFGGRGALKLAMVKADVFSVAYAMHPVATGVGDIPWPSSRSTGRACTPRRTTASSAAWGARRSSGPFTRLSRPMWPKPPATATSIIELKDGKPVYNPDRAQRDAGRVLVRR